MKKLKKLHYKKKTEDIHIITSIIVINIYSNNRKEKYENKF